MATAHQVVVEHHVRTAVAADQRERAREDHSADPQPFRPLDLQRQRAGRPACLEERSHHTFGRQTFRGFS